MVGLLLATALVSTPVCQPVDADAKVLPVVMPGAPELEPATILGRALIGEASPFELAPDAAVRQALTAEQGMGKRRRLVEKATDLLERAERSFSELEDRAALDLVAEATPMLVSGQPSAEATELLARAHLLAGAIFLARGRLDAARQRLRRALDIDPDIAPPANLRLLGILEAVRAERERGGRGSLLVTLSATATAAELFVDGRPFGPVDGRLVEVGAGRHLVRVSAPGRRSWVGTVLIEAGRQERLELRLAKDAVQADLRRLGERLAAGLDIHRAQDRLTQRADVSRTLVVSMVPSTRRSDTASLMPAMIIDLEGAGRARVDPLDLSSTRTALQALASCAARPAPELPVAAPAYPPGHGPLNSPARPTPSPQPLWSSPWFWGVAAVVALAAAGGAAAAQGMNAAPDSASATLIPRP